jgi:hypothetical protein
MMPEPIPPQVAEVPPPVAAPEPRYRWYHKVSALIFIVFAMELGIFLLVFPWSVLWDRNFFASLGPLWLRYWDNSYLRGAVSGLGLLNIYIALTEIFRLRRFTRK